MANDGPAGGRRLRDAEYFERTGSIPDDGPDHWTAPDVQGSLLAMQGRVCVYCGCESSVLDVEHFRPKGGIENEDHAGYWWLRYEASNYFLACVACNERRKGNRFPVVSGSTRVTFATREQIENEQRVLPDPTVDPVEEWLTIAMDDVSGRLIPNPALPDARQEQLREAVELLGLNLNPTIRKQRMLAFESAAHSARNHNWSELQRDSMRHRNHSLPAKLILAIEAPDQLPSRRDEQLQLALYIWRDLSIQVDELAQQERAGRTPRPMDVRQVEALCWALVMLGNELTQLDDVMWGGFYAQLFAGVPGDIGDAILRRMRGLRGVQHEDA